MSEDQDNRASDPAQAFDDLRTTIEEQNAHLAAEMTVIRKGLEAAFDQFDSYSKPIDYSANLGQMHKALEGIVAHLQALQESPGSAKGAADYYARTMERSGENIVRTAVRTLEVKSSELGRTSRDLADHIKSARHKPGICGLQGVRGP